ncbi:MAG: divalent-cation tolerance protein CutA [Alphaproteobacteria bacterium]|nr:MAG: divalent-cation tolerance protein CutA [Alphaproteobacteria bacterium]
MVELHVTCPDEDTAASLARAALRARLVACANISGPVRSLFHWQGRIEEEGEVLLALKTRRGCVADLVELIRARHPYDLPAITWAGVEAEPDTAAWIRDETGG